ncbi:MAG: hypothetical protein FJ109_04765 [Deltaproteobacteria bacterium]|nr:hypothetical protein [Deltaproteobacteria bacterium]
MMTHRISSALPPTVRRSRKEDGTVLLLAILVLVVLAAIAMIVVQQVTMEIRNAGTYRIAKQGYYVTEAGLTGPLAQASQNQNVFLGFLNTNDFTVTNDAISPSFFDFDTWGSFGPEFSTPDSGGFITRFSDPADTRRIPGYSTVGFCYRKYTVTADGCLGKGCLKGTGIDVDQPDTVQHRAEARFVSQVYLGPFQCGY